MELAIASPEHRRFGLVERDGCLGRPQIFEVRFLPVWVGRRWIAGASELPFRGDAAAATTDLRSQRSGASKPKPDSAQTKRPTAASRSQHEVTAVDHPPRVIIRRSPR